MARQTQKLVSALHGIDKNGRKKKRNRESMGKKGRNLSSIESKPRELF